MVNEFARVTIIQDSQNEYDIKITGNNNYILAGLALAVSETIKDLPEEFQQKARITFLLYLNEAK